MNDNTKLMCLLCGLFSIGILFASAITIVVIFVTRAKS